MSKYAESTSVSSEKSRMEIEKTLNRYGAGGFIYGWQGNSAVVAFEMSNRRIKFILPLPDKTSREITHTAGRGFKRSPEDAQNAWEQAGRQRWRALALAIKAKLEAVESGIATFEEEFMAHIVLPSGQTVGAWMAPQIESAYQNKKMPPLLEAPR
jgi:hypothetical protein